jgi:hypothetical protein
MRPGQIAQLLAAPLAFVVFAGLTFRGEHFTIDYPEGWSAPVKSADGIYSSYSPDRRVNCNAHTALIPALDGKTHTQLAEDFPGMDRDGWADLLGVVPETLTVTEGERRQIGEAWLHVATFTLTPGKSVKQTTMVRYAAVISPGKVNMSGCYALPAEFGAHRAVFEKTVSSLRPL